MEFLLLTIKDDPGANVNVLNSYVVRFYREISVHI